MIYTRLKNFILSRLYSINLTSKYIEDTSNSRDLSSFEKGFDPKNSFRPFKISAVYRLANEAEFLKASVMSITCLVSEVIFVTNNSDSKTLLLVDELVQVLNGIGVTAKSIPYNNDVARQGIHYCDDKKNGKSSLSEYYNFCFSHATMDYVMKVDGTMIFLPQAKKEIEKKLIHNDFIQYRGISFFGRTMSFETYLYKKNLFSYTCGDYFEQLDMGGLDNSLVYKSRIYKRLYLHMKYYKECYYISS